MRRSGGWMRRALALASTVLLLAVCLLAASCGKEGGEKTGKTGGAGTQMQIEDRGDVDALLDDLDGIMNDVDPEDFSQDKLSDSELGL